MTEAEQLLIDSIKGIQSGVSQTIDFAKEQIPDIIQQLIVWNLTNALVWVVAGVVMLSIGIWTSFKVIKRYTDTQDYDYVGIFWIFCTPLNIAGLIIMFHNSLIALKLWIAPKVWLLEYASRLLKGN